MNTLESKIKSDSDAKKKNFLSDIFRAGSIPSENNISEKYDVHFANPLFISVLIHPVLNTSQLSEASQKIMLQKVNTICERSLSQLNLDFYMSQEIYGIYILFNIDIEGAKNLNKHLTQIIHNIKYMNDLFPDIKTYVGKSSISSQYINILNQMNEAKIAAFSYVKSPSAPIVSFDEKFFKFPQIDQLPASLLIDFESSVEHLDLSKIDVTIDSMQNAYMTYNPCGYSIILFYTGILTLFINKATFYNLPINADESKNFESFILLYNSSSEIYNRLKSFIMEKLNFYVKKRDENSSKPINDIKHYIQNNFGNDISLEKLGDIFGFNASYISQLFKEETGSNFKDYLLNIRLSEAKKLLQYTDNSIEDISLSVGYSDYKHFSKLFKKHTDLSPQKYRNLYHI